MEIVFRYMTGAAIKKQVQWFIKAKDKSASGFAAAIKGALWSKEKVKAQPCRMVGAVVMSGHIYGI